jgi:hypothetical protein
VKNESLVMSNVIEAFTRNKETSKIRDFGISQTSLEDVFLNIVRSEEQEQKPAK